MGWKEKLYTLSTGFSTTLWRIWGQTMILRRFYMARKNEEEKISGAKGYIIRIEAKKQAEMACLPPPEGDKGVRNTERYPHMEQLSRPMCGCEKNFAGGRSAAIIPGRYPGWRRRSGRRRPRGPRCPPGRQARSLRRSSSSGRTRLALGSGRIMGAIPAQCPEWRRR